MKKLWINFTVDLAMFICMAFLALSGLVQKYALPPARGSRRGIGPEEMWGWTRHDWGEVHFWVAITAVALLIIHVVLHWTWIKCRFKALAGKKEQPEVCDAED